MLEKHAENKTKNYLKKLEFLFATFLKFHFFIF